MGRGKRQGQTLMRGDSGQVLVEYALVIAVLTIPMMGGMYAIEKATWAAYENVTGELLNYAARNGT